MSMTSDNNLVWDNIDKKYQIIRLTEWAEMLEKRVSELDPNYRSYAWGRNQSSIDAISPASGL